jgi:hypothetical protein
VSANPLGTALQAYLDSLRKSESGTPSQLAGYIARDGKIYPWPGDSVPYTGAIAAASEDGESGIKPAQDNGDNAKILADLFGRLFAVPFPPTVSAVLLSATTSAAGENSRIVEGEHTLLEVEAYNATGNKLYLMVFDSATLPADGTVPLFTAVPVATDDTTAISLDPYGLPFTEGIVAALSTTPLVLTLAGATAGSISIFYR